MNSNKAASDAFVHAELYMTDVPTAFSEAALLEAFREGLRPWSDEGGHSPIVWLELVRTEGSGAVEGAHQGFGFLMLEVPLSSSAAIVSAAVTAFEQAVPCPPATIRPIESCEGYIKFSNSACDEAALRELFSPFGEIEWVDIVAGAPADATNDDAAANEKEEVAAEIGGGKVKKGLRRSYGFVRMDTPSAALRARLALRGTTFVHNGVASRLVMRPAIIERADLVKGRNDGIDLSLYPHVREYMGFCKQYLKGECKCGDYADRGKDEEQAEGNVEGGGQKLAQCKYWHGPPESFSLYKNIYAKVLKKMARERNALAERSVRGAQQTSVRGQKAAAEAKGFVLTNPNGRVTNSNKGVDESLPPFDYARLSGGVLATTSRGCEEGDAPAGSTSGEEERREPPASAAAADIAIVTDEAGAAAALATIRARGGGAVGFDTEWNNKATDRPGPHVVQFAVIDVAAAAEGKAVADSTSAASGHAFVFIMNSATWPTVRHILEDEVLLKVGFDLRNDAKLMRHHNIAVMHNMLDLAVGEGRALCIEAANVARRREEEKEDGGGGAVLLSDTSNQENALVSSSSEVMPLAPIGSSPSPLLSQSSSPTPAAAALSADCSPLLPIKSDSSGVSIDPRGSLGLARAMTAVCRRAFIKDRAVCVSNWAADGAPLTENGLSRRQIEYAANDAYGAIAVFKTAFDATQRLLRGEGAAGAKAVAGDEEGPSPFIARCRRDEGDGAAWKGYGKVIGHHAKGAIGGSSGMPAKT